MANLLVLGGTAWLGREVARTAAGRGHDVTCLARGESGAAADGVRWVRADRSRSGAYDEVAGQDWDAVVDVSWQPGLVRSAVHALRDRTAHWTYVSSCSVYADHSQADADESAALLPALGPDEAGREQYGEAKVACEQVCAELLGDRLLIARCGLIGGYGDQTDRFGYWPARFAAAAEQDPQWAGNPMVLVPDEDQLATQTIDVRDLAAWMVRSGEQHLTGTFNAVGGRQPLGAVLRAAREAAGFAGDVVQVPSAWLSGQAVEQYMGPRSLPLWIADPEWAGFSRRDASAAYAAGLTLRPLSALVVDALRWERELGLGRERNAGLTPEQERELIFAWRAQR